MRELIRVNTRISQKMNEWLDERSKETGIAKSTLIMLALENYKQQQQTMEYMGDMNELLSRLELLTQQGEKRDLEYHDEPNSKENQ